MIDSETKDWLMDRYSLELLLTDMFSRCDTHDDLMEMYSDCMRVLQDIEYKRREELKEDQLEIRLKLGRWCDELH